MAEKLNAAISVIGIDIGKNAFHVVGLDKRGAIVLRQRWSRGQIAPRLANIPACLIGMEACVGAHHLSRRLTMLGHDARLMPAKYVRPYSKGQKNDFHDVEAIAEAVQRPTMKFVATKTADQLDPQALHRLDRRRTCFWSHRVHRACRHGFPARLARFFQRRAARAGAGNTLSAERRTFLRRRWAGTRALFDSQGAGRVLLPVLAGTVRMVIAAFIGWSAVFWLGASLTTLFQIIALAAVTYGVLTATAMLTGAWGRRPASSPPTETGQAE